MPDDNMNQNDTNTQYQPEENPMLEPNENPMPAPEPVQQFQAYQPLEQPSQQYQQDPQVSQQFQQYPQDPTLNQQYQPQYAQWPSTPSQPQQKKPLIPSWLILVVSVVLIGALVLIFSSVGKSSKNKSGDASNGGNSNDRKTAYYAAQTAFKNEALSAISISDNMATEISMDYNKANFYFKNSTNNNYRAMCVTLHGLVQNGYLNKDLRNGDLRGVILVEMPYAGGETKRSIWIVDGDLAITGYEQTRIDQLGYTDSKLSGTYYGGATGGIVSDLSLADNIIHGANGKKNKIDDGTVTPQMGTFNESYAYTNNAANMRLSRMHSPSIDNGGTEEVYENIICINQKLY